MNLDLQFYWGLFLKRLPVMLALFLVCFIGATVTALKLPPTYSTSAKLLVEESQIPDSMVGPTAPSDAGRQLQVIEQRLLTRANMLDIARKFRVLENMRDMSPDDIISQMRSQTRIRRTGGRGQATLMSVSFKARSGRIASEVVNEYVTLILQENSDFRMSRAKSMLSFFEQEVERLSADLDIQSVKMVDFKNQNSDSLPDDLIYRQNRQTLLQERQARLERDIASLQKQRRDMVATFETTGHLAVDETASLSPEEQQLKKLRFDMEQALTIYSESNPRIVLMRNRIASLEKMLENRASSLPPPNPDAPRPTSMFELTLAEMDQRVEGMQNELANVTDKLDGLARSIQATAQNALSLNALERDFGNIQARYNEAVQNLNQARVNERIEVSAQGQRVTVIENASVPQTPSGPKRFRLIATGIAVGGGLAVGFFSLLEMLNRAIRRPFELQSRFGVIPLAVIPYMESRRERMIRRTALVSAFLAVLIGVPAALWYIDTSYMPLDILANKVFDRLGLT